jgi:hypothetical protein
MVRGRSSVADTFPSSGKNFSKDDPMRLKSHMIAFVEYLR